ncbi:PBS lyase [Geomonas limicola]|uniref:PBS lyase n=1 Tax=Geomonas limicola TaxID=2740186 RepID=A0A6V8NB52_9BACT|nr:PBS lyase [Geomonas limicola]
MIGLAHQPLEAAMPLLFCAMGDGSWRVRKDAVATLLAAQPLKAETVEGIIDLLRSADNAGLRASAVELLERLGTRAVAPLCGHLSDPDHDLRKFVIDILGSIGSSSCLPLLVSALDDPDPNVRVAAAENLGKIGDAQAHPPLLKVLEGGDLWLKFTVLDALGKIGVPVPLEVLTPLLGESLLRRAVYDCLGLLGEPACAPLLLKGLGEPVKNAREAAVVALMRLRVRLGGAEAQELIDRPLKELKGSTQVAGLLASLDGTDPVVLDAVVRVVGIMGEERAVPGLLAVARQERHRAACLQAFRGVGESALATLLERYPEAHAQEQAFIAQVAGELGLVEAVDLVREGLEDDAPQLRSACALALAKLAPKGAARRIASLLGDPAHEVAEAALEALRRLSSREPEELTRLCSDLSQSGRPERRRDAALLLASLSDSERLGLMVKDEDAGVRTAAVTSLARCGQPQSVGSLVMALVDESPQVRVAAAQALGEVGGTDAVEPLLLALNDADPWVQTAALKGLAALGDPRALPGVVALIADARGPVLIAGLGTVAALGEGADLAPVEAALANSDEEVVQAAIGILCGTGNGWIERHCDPLLGHPHWGVRRCFARALAEALGTAALSRLETALSQETDPLVRGEISGLLGRLG